MATSPGDTSKPFVVRWNKLVRILLVETSVKAVGWAAMTYGDVDDGSRVRPSLERMERNVSASKNTVRKAWDIFAGCGMTEQVGVSHWNGRFRTANEYQLIIPGNWSGLPVLGPNEGKFICQDCGHLFNPPAIAVACGDGVRWRLSKAVFCSDRCREAWNAAEIKARRTLPWNGKDDDRAWRLFYAARNDEWPASLSAAA